MSVTSEVSKHRTMVSFEKVSANIVLLLSFDNTKLVSLKQGGGVVVNANRLKKSDLIENLIEFVLSNKWPHERNFFNLKILKVVIHSVILLLLHCYPTTRTRSNHVRELNKRIKLYIVTVLSNHALFFDGDICGNIIIDQSKFFTFVSIRLIK